jgi:phage host-nuclease inhibitor protein Gam
MTTRIKPATLTRDDAERLVGEIAAAVNQQRSITAQIDDEILRIRTSREGDLVDLAAAIKEKSALVQAWADANHDAFGNRKSLTLTHGTIGYRTGNPKVKTLAGWTFSRVLEKLKSLPWGHAFVRVKEELDKDAILSTHATGSFSPGDLRTIGVRVEQDETFFVDPNLTETETRQTAEA